MRLFPVVMMILCLVILPFLSIMEVSETSQEDGALVVGTRATIYVPADQPTITDAIIAAINADTIQVSAGTYHENVVIPKGKSITLMGAGSSTTSIIGDGTDSVVKVYSTFSRVDGFTITGSGMGRGQAGIFLNTSGTTIANCNITGNNIGIYVNKSNSNNIMDNEIYNNIGADCNTEGLVASWKFDEQFYLGSAGEAKDSSPMQNDGTAIGGATTTLGKKGRGVSVDGVTRCIEVPDDPSLDISGNITLSTWVWFDTLASSPSFGNYMIMSKYDANEIDDSNFILENRGEQNGRLAFSIHNNVESWAVWAIDSALTTNQWMHIAVTYDEVSDPVFYIDGIRTPSTQIIGTAPVAMGINNANVVLGANDLASRSQFMDGTIDEAKIFNRTLTQDEVRAEYLFGVTGGIRLWQAGNNIISGNEIIGNSGPGIFGIGADHNHIHNNTLDRNMNSGILLEESEGNRIQYNQANENFGIDIVSEGLVGYWKLDEDSWSGATDEVRDSSGNENHGTTHNGAAVGKGLFNTAGSFDGTNDKIVIPNSSSLDPGEGDFTLSVWVRPTATTQHGGIIDKRDARGWSLRYGNHGGKTKFRFIGHGDGQWSVYSDENPVEDQWYNLVGQRVRGNIYMYVNGVKQSSTQVVFGTMFDPVNMTIGCTALNSNFLTGNIDEVSIYKRALHSEEIVSNYLAGKHAGIHLQNSDETKLYNNTFSHNYGDGLRLESCNSGEIKRNVLEENNGSGVFVLDSSFHTITGNIIADNGCWDSMARCGISGDWRMDGSSWTSSAGEVRDRSGNNNHGIGRNGANTMTNSVYGRAGDFDGVDDYVNVGRGESLNASYEITVEAWIYPQGWGELAGTGYGRIIDKDRYLMFLHNTDHTNYGDYSLIFAVTEGGMTYPGNTPAFTINLDTWQHVMATYDGRVIRMYINGVGYPVSFPSGLPDGPIDDSSNFDLFVGESLGADRAFDGGIDGLRVYKRALSYDECKERYRTSQLGGLGLAGAHSNAINNNVIKGSEDYGIHVFKDSNTNQIDHNYILENNPGWKQGHDESGTTNYDDGNAGNYWSDWLNPDADNNGIVDDPYELKSLVTSQDDHPLTPWIIKPANQTPYEETPYTGQVTFANGYLPGDWNVVDKPDWLMLHPNGSLEGTPENSDVGINWLNASISDAYVTKHLNLSLDVKDKNDIPQILTDNVLTAWEDELYVVNYTGLDPDLTGDVLAWTVDTNASWLGMTSEGNLSGTPENGDVGTYYVNVSVSDGRGGVNTTMFDLVVFNTNDPLIWVTTPENFTMTVLENYAAAALAADIDPGEVISYGISSEPSSTIAVDGAGQISWTPDTRGEYEINLTATDGEVTIYHIYYITVKGLNKKPVAVLSSPENGTTVDVLNPAMLWSVSDGDGENVTSDVYLSTVISDVVSLADSVKVATSLTGTYFIPFAALEKGSTYYWTVIPFDGKDYGTCQSGIFNFRIAEDATINNPPKFASEPPMEAGVNVTYTYEPIVTDPDGDEITITLVKGPMGMELVDPVLTWTPTSDQLGKHDVKLEATDGRTQISQTFKITVTLEGPTNTAPVIETIADVEINEGEKLSIFVLANDAEGDPLTYEITAGPPGLSVSKTGSITWQTMIGDKGVYDVAVKVSDGSMSDTELFRVTVKAKDTPPDDDVVITDTDGDGMDDDWEREHFGDLSAEPDADPDGDGRTNIEEFQDKTDPNKEDEPPKPDDDDDDDTSGLNLAVCIIVPIIIVIIIVIIVIIIIMKKRGKDQEEPPEEEPTGDVEEPEVEMGSDDLFTKKKAEKLEQAEQSADPIYGDPEDISPMEPLEGEADVIDPESTMEAMPDLAQLPPASDEDIQAYQEEMGEEEPDEKLPEMSPTPFEDEPVVNDFAIPKWDAPAPKAKEEKKSSPKRKRSKK